MKFNLDKFRDIQNLIRSEKKLMILSATALLALIILFFAVYLPAQNKAKTFEKESSQVAGQIKQIEDMVGDATTGGKSLVRFKERFEALDRKFPTGEKEALTMISTFAQRLNIDIGAMKPKPKKDFMDETDNKVMIDGKTCQILGVSLEMRALYEDLVEYIEVLREMLPSLVSIDNLKIIKDRVESQVLHIRLDLNLYLLS